MFALFSKGYDTQVRVTGPSWPSFGFFASNVKFYAYEIQIRASVAQLDAGPTGDQEVTGSTPAMSAILFRGDLIMKYFLQSFSPFH